MDCDFIESLTAEQKDKLRKALDKDMEQPKYRVEVKYWDNGNIKNLKEYLGNKLHGISIWWYSDGQKECETNYHQGQPHGKVISYYNETGQKEWEKEYRNNQLHGRSTWWHRDGYKQWEEKYENGKLVKEIL